MRIVIVGPGRAGGAVALAAGRAGHHIAAVVPGPSGRIPAGIDAPAVPLGSIPTCDLLIVAVRDDVIGDVAGAIGSVDAGTAVHLSGFTSIEALRPLAGSGTAIGSIHPLQSLVDPERGAMALRGSFAAVTSDGPTAVTLSSFVRSIGMRPFRLDDTDKPAHHAAASAASNFVVAALAVAAELARRPGIPFEAYASLTRSVVDNAYEVGPDSALTGPIARGDVGTVAGQLRAAAVVSADLRHRYAALVEATARMVERWGEFAGVVEDR